jgi:hypothetical protein
VLAKQSADYWAKKSVEAQKGLAAEFSRQNPGATEAEVKAAASVLQQLHHGDSKSSTASKQFQPADVMLR